MTTNTPPSPSLSYPATLHTKIQSLEPVEQYHGFNQHQMDMNAAYSDGYRACRHAAAELASAVDTDRAARSMEGAVAWNQSTAELAAMYGEMSAINETRDKDKTQAQFERLAVLRAECTEIHFKRISLNTHPDPQVARLMEALEKTTNWLTRFCDELSSRTFFNELTFGEVAVRDAIREARRILAGGEGGGR